MRISRFYSPRQNIRVGSSVKLEDSDVSHIKDSLRLSKNDKIIIFNGQREFLARLNIVTKKVITAKVLEELKRKTEAVDGLKITIFLGLLKGSKIDELIKQLTELGLDELVPLETDYSQLKAQHALNRMARWNKISIASAKQCERIDTLKIHKPILFKDLENVLNEYQFDKVFFLTIPRDKSGFNLSDFQDVSLDNTNKNIAYVVGAEGGFSKSENDIVKKLGLCIVNPFLNILRSETAALSFLILLNLLCEKRKYV